MEARKPITEEIVRSYLGFLLAEFGFTIKENAYCKKNSDAAIVVLSSGDLNIRIARNREQLCVSINSPFDEGVWFGLNDVLSVIMNENSEICEAVVPYGGAISDGELCEVSSLLHKNMREILSLFEISRYERTKQILSCKANCPPLPDETFPCSTRVIEDESFQYYGILQEEESMVFDLDTIVKMPPKRSEAVKLTTFGVKKADPQIVEPDF